MNRRYQADMPEELRHQLRTGQHPARAIACPHCAAHPHKPCALRKSKRTLPDPHPQRLAAWAQLTACCPECQVEPGISCRSPDGFALPTGSVHSRRYQEAEETGP